MKRIRLSFLLLLLAILLAPVSSLHAETENVKGYTKKDGTHVSGYTRHKKK